MQECPNPQCGATLPPDAQAFCESCGGALPTAERGPTDPPPTEQDNHAAQNPAVGLTAARSGLSRPTGSGAAFGPGEAGEALSRPAAEEDEAPVLLEFNASRFYMEGKTGALDFRLTSRTDEPIRELRLNIDCHDLAPQKQIHVRELRPGRTSRKPCNVRPCHSGEVAAELELRCRVGQRTLVYRACPMIRILEPFTNPQHVQFHVDQSMKAGGSIGYGNSVRKEVSDRVARGIIRSANDLLQARLEDAWEQIPLEFDDELTRRLDETASRKAPLRPMEPRLTPSPARQGAAIVCPEAAHTLLLIRNELRLGRKRASSDPDRGT